MGFLDTVRQAAALLHDVGRVSERALRREFDLDDQHLDDLVEELVEVRRVATRDGDVLVAVSRPETSKGAAPPDPGAAARSDSAPSRRRLPSQLGILRAANTARPPRRSLVRRRRSEWFHRSCLCVPVGSPASSELSHCTVPARFVPDRRYHKYRAARLSHPDRLLNRVLRLGLTQKAVVADGTMVLGINGMVCFPPAGENRPYKR